MSVHSTFIQVDPPEASLPQRTRREEIVTKRTTISHPVPTYLYESNEISQIDCDSQSALEVLDVRKRIQYKKSTIERADLDGTNAKWYFIHLIYIRGEKGRSWVAIWLEGWRIWSEWDG